MRGENTVHMETAHNDDGLSDETEISTCTNRLDMGDTPPLPAGGSPS